MTTCCTPAGLPAPKLTDLEPRWYAIEGHKVGLTFKCPHCQTQRLGVPFHHDGHAEMENAYIIAHHGAADDKHIWDLKGQDDFATLTLEPSIDASDSGHAHFTITDGFIR